MNRPSLPRAVTVLCLLGLLLLASCDEGPPPADDVSAAGEINATEAQATRFAEQRQALVKRGVVDLGIRDERVIAVLRDVPRHAFVPEEYVGQAYENHPLPIGFGQTISQPSVVALMTEAVKPEASDRVLEVGTGSGYQAAVLSELVDHVYSVEIIEPLARRAADTLERLGYDNVTVRHADGYFGWEDQAPFDAIVVTAAPDHIPQPLVEQLAVGAHMVIPVGPVGGIQTLWLITKEADGQVTTRDLGSVTFVPLTRDEG